MEVSMASHDETLPEGQRPAATPATLTLDKEWETARSTVVHFDTLLMQIRTFGLPFIATAIGAGAALGTQTGRIDTTPGVLAALSIALGASVLLTFLTLVGFYIADREKRNEARASASDDEKDAERRLAVGFQEYAALVFLSGSFLAWGIWIGIDEPPPFLLSAPVLIFGGLLLVPIYLLDRFYYSSLLVGAVGRAAELEGGSLAGKLTGRISKRAPDWTFKTLPMLFYVLPILLLVNVGLAMIGFASEPEPECEVTIKTSIEGDSIRLLSEIPAEVAASCLE
jgi:hypothetical protein